jgi:oligoendopeptidase F
VLTVTDLSLIFLGILIVMVLLEVRKLSRQSEPGSRLEEQFERLSRQMARNRPQELSLPGGAQLVEAGHRFETVSEQLERLGGATKELHTALRTEEGARRFAAGLEQLQRELAMARSLFEETAHGLDQASDSVLAAGSALHRIETQLEHILAPARATPEGTEL